ncbi:MAG: hypothetical protein EBX69_12815 [Betaproteobacteria bacterium]|nr:hypothetical protein [Betaproteobacteria bacterium]
MFSLALLNPTKAVIPNQATSFDIKLIKHSPWNKRTATKGECFATFKNSIKGTLYIYWHASQSGLSTAQNCALSAEAAAAADGAIAA